MDDGGLFDFLMFMDEPRRVAVAEEEWTPASVSGLSVWLAADEITGKNDNDAISQWDDLSGNSNHVVQATGTKQPTYQTNELNGLPVVRFDGTDDELLKTLALNQPSTAFIVVKATAKGTRRALGATGLRIRADNDPTGWSVDAGTALASLVLVNTTGFQQVTGLFNGTSSLVRVDGVEVTGNAGTTAVSAVSVGSQSGGSYLAGDIAEVLVYNAAVSGADILLIEDYLATKYGL